MTALGSIRLNALHRVREAASFRFCQSTTSAAILFHKSPYFRFGQRHRLQTTARKREVINIYQLLSENLLLLFLGLDVVNKSPVLGSQRPQYFWGAFEAVPVFVLFNICDDAARQILDNARLAEHKRTGGAAVYLAALSTPSAIQL